MTENNFDIIIIGAGVSGLILAYEIIERTNKRVLILEKRKKINLYKNLCFWNIPQNILTKYAENKWEKICVIINEKKTTLYSDRIKYMRIKSQDVFKFFLERLNKHQNFKLLMGQNINYLKKDNDSITVGTKKIKYKSSLLFDSRIDKDIHKSKKLIQHFYGAEIVFEDEAINEDEVILMDLQDNKKDFNFIYILPYSKKKVLIETTYFSDKVLTLPDYKKDLEEYISKNYFGKKYKIMNLETGIIPMFKFQEENTNNYIKIGTAGNWVKQSTGYSLQNSFTFSRQLVDCIIEGKKPQIKKRMVYDFLDNTFCKFALKNPRGLKLFFEKFFKYNNLYSIVRFLTNSANLLEILRIIITLPKFLLIKAVLEK